MAENHETNHGLSIGDPFNTDHKQETTTKTTLHESVMSDACIEVKHPAMAELKQPAIPSFEELPEPSTLHSEIDHRITDIIDVIARPVLKLVLKSISYYIGCNNSHVNYIQYISFHY